MGFSDSNRVPDHRVRELADRPIIGRSCVGARKLAGGCVRKWSWVDDARWCEDHEDRDVMTAKRAIGRLGGLVAILGLALLLPACAFPPWLNNRGPNAVYDVQRPTYEPDTGKPFFVGGYAGADYGPLFPRRRMQLEAQGQPVTTGPSVSVEEGAWEPE
jgi:hypothetical protein